MRSARLSRRTSAVITHPVASSRRGRRSQSASGVVARSVSPSPTGPSLQTDDPSRPSPRESRPPSPPARRPSPVARPAESARKRRSLPRFQKPLLHQPGEERPEVAAQLHGRYLVFAAEGLERLLHRRRGRHPCPHPGPDAVEPEIGPGLQVRRTDSPPSSRTRTCAGARRRTSKGTDGIPKEDSRSSRWWHRGRSSRRTGASGLRGSRVSASAAS